MYFFTNFNQAPYAPGRPKRPQRMAKGTPKEPKVRPRAPKEIKRSPELAQGLPKTLQRHTKEAKGSRRDYVYIYIYIYQKTPDQPPKQTLCYYHKTLTTTLPSQFWIFQDLDLGTCGMCSYAYLKTYKQNIAAFFQLSDLDKINEAAKMAQNKGDDIQNLI